MSMLDFLCVISEVSLKAVPRVWILHLAYLQNVEKPWYHLAAFSSVRTKCEGQQVSA